MTPDDPEARIALATAAVDAREWLEAREALAPLIGKNPTARVCALMARIEGGEKRDAGRVREWLARAVRAPRDAVWMADGVISNEWQPLSPVTGALDAFQWRVPPDQLLVGDKDPLLDDIAMLSQELDAATKHIADAKLAEERGAKTGPAGPLTINATVEETGGETAPETQKEPKPGASAQGEIAGTSAAGATSVPATTGQASLPAVVTEAPKAEPAPQPQIPARKGGEPGASAEETEQQDGARGAKTETPPAEEVMPPAKKAAPKAPPRIFVPDRPPDDPGPDSTDLDETSTPYSRFRHSLKPQVG
jgi:HemY protein